jgi:hypothetical protein
LEDLEDTEDDLEDALEGGEWMNYIENQREREWVYIDRNSGSKQAK